MAQPHEIETLRSMALEEQYSANYEGRVPDRNLLDELGAAVMADFAPTLCLTPTAYYSDFDPDTGYKYEELNMHVPVVGSFGGFTTLDIRHDFDNDGVVSVQKVGYFIMNSAYKDTGYFCPVETTKLVDVIETLGLDDVFYNDLSHCVGSSEADTVDVDELVKVTRLIGLSNPNFNLYAALIRSIITPAEVFKQATFSGCYLIDRENEVATYNGVTINDTTARGDYLQLIEFGAPEPQILLRKGRYHPLALSLSDIINYERAAQD